MGDYRNQWEIKGQIDLPGLSTKFGAPGAFMLEFSASLKLHVTHQEFDVPILSFDIWNQCFILSVGSWLVRLNVNKCDQ